MPTPSSIRSTSLLALNDAGFRCATSLPLSDSNAELRPASEIAARFAALRALFLYVAAPESRFPESTLRPAMSGLLKSHFTPKELAIISMPRDEAFRRHDNMIGWKTENMVALAWVLNQQPQLSFDFSMLTHEMMAHLLTQIIPTESPLDSWIENASTRSRDEVLQMEDTFYCFHNAARCAQFPAKPSWRHIFSQQPSPVPAGFNPSANGGVIHERRHALTWSLSPGTAWDDTDLST